MTPAATLKALRKKAKLTQEELAVKAGVNRSWVNQMERGNRPIGPSPAAKLAKVLGVSPEELGAETEIRAEYRPLHDRLAAVEAQVAEERRLRQQRLRAVTKRLAELEAALELRGRPEAPRQKGRGQRVDPR